jgi:hypothetical protein
MTDRIPLSSKSTIEFRQHSLNPRHFAGSSQEWKSLKDRIGDRDIVFRLHVPTYAQRDTLGSLLFRHGMIPLTVEHGRAVLISEIYEVYALPDEDGTVPAGKQKGDPDEIAGFLESYWQRAEIHNQAVEQWQMQEIERFKDELAGAPAREGDPAPIPPFTTRETARAQMLAMDMLEWSERYRECQSRYGEEEANEMLMLFRVFTAGWEGLNTLVVVDTLGKLTEATVEALRKELEELGAPQVYREVVAEIRRQCGVSKELEKNSESPLGVDSNPSGLNERSVELDASAGNSTTSSTTPAPRSASRRTSSTSSSSRSGAGTKKSKSSRTAAVS